jgi:hypothetical protein
MQAILVVDPGYNVYWRLILYVQIDGTALPD